MKRGVVLAAAAAALFLASSAPAQATIVKKWSMNVGVMGGIDKVDENTKWEDTTITGGRLGLAVMPGFQVEAAYDKYDTKPKDSNAPHQDITTKYTGLRFVGTFFAQEDVKVLPYVVAGVGRVRSEVQEKKEVLTSPPAPQTPVMKTLMITTTDDGTYGEMGFGARIFLWKNLNLRGEVGFRQSRTLDITQTNTTVGVTVSYIFFGAE
jgi:hypothetical protein